MRDVAHQISDAVYEKILGVPGAFWTRIAYVTASGLGRQSRYALMVADADGYGPRTVVNSSEPLMSPSWSRTGAGWPMSASRGGNSGSTSRTSPAARARSQLPRHQRRAELRRRQPPGADPVQGENNPDIYVMDLGGSTSPRSPTISASTPKPSWSGWGQPCITSDRGGRPRDLSQESCRWQRHPDQLRGQLHNASPSVSFDGKIATAQGAGNTTASPCSTAASAAAAGACSRPARRIPSFAPNGAMMVPPRARAVAACCTAGPPMPGCASDWCCPRPMSASRRGRHYRKK